MMDMIAREPRRDRLPDTIGAIVIVCKTSPVGIASVTGIVIIDLILRACTRGPSEYRVCVLGFTVYVYRRAGLYYLK